MNRRSFQKLLSPLVAAVLMLGGIFLAQAQDGGGTLTRDIIGGAALIFRKPENPQVGGGRLAERSDRSDRSERSERAQPRPRSRAQNQLIAKGNAARTAGKARYPEAVKHYSEAASLDPTDERAFAGLGNIYFDQGQFEDAAKKYRQAIELKKDYVDALMPLGLALVRLNQYSDAINAYTDARKVDPNNPEIHNNLAYIYNQKGEYGKAVAAGDEAIRLLGITGEAYLQGFQNREEVLSHAYKNLGNAYNGLKQYGKAAEVLKQATVIQPKNAAAHFNLGLALYNDRRYSEAIQAYKEVTTLRPSLAAGHFNLALAYLAINDKAAATAEYEALKKIDPKIADQLHTLLKQ